MKQDTIYTILFRDNIRILPEEISDAISAFGSGYTRTIHQVILTTDNTDIDKAIFIENTARILSSFKMTRNGPFKGIGFDSKGQIKGPVAKLGECWVAVRSEIAALQSNLKQWELTPRARTIALMSDSQTKVMANLIWTACKKLLPITMSSHSYGLVAASKILFAVFPEIVLPVDNAEWKKVFKTVDLGDVTKLMKSEIAAWENRTGRNIDLCEKANVPTTLPAIYNVMAMKARP